MGKKLTEEEALIRYFKVLQLIFKDEPPKKVTRDYRRVNNLPKKKNK